MERKEIFLILTAVLVLLLILQIWGFFSGLNRAVDKALPPGGPVVSLLTATASGITVLYLLLLFLLDVEREGRLSRLTLELTAALIISMAIVAVLKVLTNFPRPGEVETSWGIVERIGHLGYFSFPSGHTTRASVFAYFLSKRWKRLWPIWWGWAVAIALSRLLLHVHWFSDVLFGLLLGPWTGLLVELSENRWLPLYRTVVRKLGAGVLDVE
ncbi:phosphatase PAP2 family protein [Thermococcus sp.]